MKRPLQNTLALFLGDAGSRIVGFFITVYIARILEPSGYGVINIGLAVLGYLLLAGSPGIQILETRNVAATKGIDEQRIGGVLGMRLLLAIVLCLGTLAGVHIFVADEAIRNVILGYASVLLPLAFMLDWFFQGKEDLLLVGFSRILHAIVYGLLVFLLVTDPADILFTPFAYVAGYVAVVALLFAVYARRHGRPRIDWNPRLWQDILTSNVPVGIANFLAQSVANLPPLVIGLVLTTADVGIYSAALRIAFVVLMADRIFTALFLPVITRNWSSSPEEMRRLLKVAWKVVGFVAIPLAGCGVIFAEQVVGFVFGNAYKEAATVMMVLMGYVGLTLLNSVVVNTLIACGEEKSYVRIMLISTVVLTGAIVGLTFVKGVVGAAIGVVVGEIFALYLCMRSAQKITGVPLGRMTLHPALAACAMAGCIILLRGSEPVLVALAACTGFVAVMFVSGGIGREEWRFLMERFV